MFVQTPSKNKKKGISGGQPAKNKRKNFLIKGFNTDGSAPKYGRRVKTDPTSKISKLPAFTPWKIVLAVFLIGICGIIYISHVFNTQQTLKEVNQLENEYNKALRIYQENRLAYERLTGPKVIYQKARELGFENAGPADQIIYIRTDKE
ncbi:hypothetical protein [Rhodohalobacter sp. 614A]|uniref:hypothetical protein n=1 Tax=Rhodohalobacter sp. 614A TaxID=2908649 RepID=UPI001F3D3B90|nr:hypothetical protein [Rhodohalobacter sp. 614A]